MLLHIQGSNLFTPLPCLLLQGTPLFDRLLQNIHDLLVP
jgi:hypothetical protein